MQTTENLGLNLPEVGDFADIKKLNENFEKLDEKLGKIGNYKSVSTEPNQGLTEEEKANARSNIGAGESGFSGNYSDLKNIPDEFPPAQHTHTSEEVGLGNVPNVSTNDQAPTYSEADVLEELKSGEKLSVAFGKIKKAVSSLISLNKNSYTLEDYYDEATLTKDCYELKGSAIPDENWCITDYIPCAYGDIVYGASNNSENSLPVIALYDKNKNWIADVLYSGINNMQWKVTIENSNAKYFRANIASAWLGTSNTLQYLIVERGRRDSEIIVTVNPNKPIALLNATDFTKGLSIAYNLGNCTLLVEAGEYDIISELGNLFNSYAIGNNGAKNWGLLIGNNVKVVGNGNVKLKANYTGSSPYITDYFSILNSTGSFELNGINTECQNIRYCLHEDIPGIATEPFSTSAKVINCNMTHKGTVSNTYVAPCCIGGGTAYNEAVLIEGGYYSSPSTYPYPISYHNNSHSGNKAILILSNVQFSSGNTLQLYGFMESGSTVDVYVNCYLPLGIHMVGTEDRFTTHVEPTNSGSGTSGSEWEYINTFTSNGSFTLDTSPYSEFMMVMISTDGSLILNSISFLIASLKYATNNTAILLYPYDPENYITKIIYNGGSSFSVEISGGGNPKLAIYAK